MEWILILLGILWLVSPIVLLIFWLSERKARRKTQAALRDFLSGNRPSAASARPFVMPPQEMPAQQSIPVPQEMPQMPPPDQTDEPAHAPAAPTVFTPPTFSGVMQPPVPAPAPMPDPGSAPAPDTPASDSAEPAAPAPAAAEVTPPQITPPQITPPAAPPAAPHAAPYPQPARTEMQISAITVMLAVGVLLIVAAGLMFVLSQWESFSNSGKLTALAAGSVLFFGASAVARKGFSLERTGMAFFVIGTAFLPISVWGAGCFGLLGESLHSPTSNLLIALAFLSFTVVALLAVRIYMQLGWGIGFLLGLTGTYLYFVRAMIAPREFSEDFQYAMFLLFSSVWALLLGYLSRPVRDFCPLPIARALEPFGICYAFLNAIFMLGLLAADSDYMLYGAASLLAAAVFFSPVLLDRIKSFAAIPVACTAALGFFRLFAPLETHSYTERSYLFYGTAYTGLVLMVCALLFLLLLLTDSLPEHSRRGFMIGAYAFGILSLLPQLDCSANLPLILVLALMTAVTAVLALRTKDTLLKCIVGASLTVLCLDINAAQTVLTEHGADLLLVAALLLGCFLLLTAVKRLHTVFSDFLLLILSSVYAASAMEDAVSFEGWAKTETAGKGVFIAALCIFMLILAVYWFLATARETAKPHQYAFAALLPFTMFGTALFISAEVNFSADDENVIWLLWSICSYAFGLLAYYTTKKRFNGVRRLLFVLGIVPPMVLAFFTESVMDAEWRMPVLLLAAAVSVLCWRIFSNRGFRALSIAGFAAALLFVLETTWYWLNDVMYGQTTALTFNFTIGMLTALWILALSILAIVIRNGILRFVGSDSIPAVMQAAAPLTALLLASALLSLTAIEWAALCAVYTIAACVLAWLTTKKTQFILPGLSALALLLTFEAIRAHVPWNTYSEGEKDGAVIFMLVCFAGLTLLFPYLGKVLREPEQPREEKRRSYVLTALGALIPVWAVGAASDSARYTADERSWIRFFVPVLAAGFLMHFVREAETETEKKGFVTVSAAFIMIAFWMQPFIHVEDTYWEGKLHLLPLLGFTILLRLLYGRETGGLLLFAAGVYSMLRLGGAAIFSDDLADFLTVLICALAIFLVSFYVKQKKWFLLGGVSLVCIALYLHTKLNMDWWGFLLIAGLLLIAVAGANETLKKRGESLKEKAGRLWEDWRW